MVAFNMMCIDYRISSELYNSSHKNVTNPTLKNTFHSPPVQSDLFTQTLKINLSSCSLFIITVPCFLAVVVWPDMPVIIMDTRCAPLKMSFQLAESSFLITLKEIVTLILYASNILVQED